MDLKIKLIVANDYFRFKQFSIQQGLCAMKVTTVACIQGAWFPDFAPEAILDIGAGTGLLSLMAAQKFTGKIDAVEIDDGAFSQLAENIHNSLWSNRIESHHEDIRKYARKSRMQYDLIISNPPFYQNQLRSGNDQYDQARHGTSLLYSELVEVCCKLLSDTGKISILLPPVETSQITLMFKSRGIYLSDQLAICDTPAHKPKTIVSIYSKRAQSPTSNYLAIKDGQGRYTSGFVVLLKDYYLYL